MSEETIREFLEGAEQYIKTLERCGHQTCFVCGMKAEKESDREQVRRYWNLINPKKDSIK